MVDTPVYHHLALGIHPAAFVGSDAPITTDLQNHVLWVDTSDGPPYQLKVWDQDTASWLDVGIVVTGVGSDGALTGNCLIFPNAAELCNPSADLVTLATPLGEHQWDETGITLPGGHRLEVVAV